MPRSVDRRPLPVATIVWQAVATHWPEYLMEAAGLGLFMISACLFVALFEYPGSPVRPLAPEGFTRRALIGVAMGLTAIALIKSPWGRRSGAHLNPAVTLAFLRLRKIDAADAAFYVVAQCVGAISGVVLAGLLLGPKLITDPSVDHVVTQPGRDGPYVAWMAEAAISFGLMLAVLVVSNRPALNRFTALVAGALIAIYITVEAPLSGMSMNPARTIGSAAAAHDWTAVWVYLTAPPVGMLLAAEAYLRRIGLHRVLCAKFDHGDDSRCIFRCRFPHDHR